jgi:hypothetical protein
LLRCIPRLNLVVFAAVDEVPVLTHRYSFDNDASDSVGRANGTLEGSAAVSGGQVHLDGKRGTYVNLPGGSPAQRSV